MKETIEILNDLGNYLEERFTSDITIVNRHSVSTDWIVLQMDVIVENHQINGDSHDKSRYYDIEVRIRDGMYCCRRRELPEFKVPLSDPEAYNKIAKTYINSYYARVYNAVNNLRKVRDVLLLQNPVI